MWGWWWWWRHHHLPQSPLQPATTIEWFFKTGILTIKTCLLVFHTDHILTIHLQKLMVNKEPIPSRSKHFSRSRGEKTNAESLEFYKFVGGSKHLAADESTTMEVIFPSLNWNPMCPDESWPLKDRDKCALILHWQGKTVVFSWATSTISEVHLAKCGVNFSK